MQRVENLFTTDCVRTVSGNYVNVVDPKPETITIEDIAHSLSHMPRFGGHLPVYYCVAQHSLEVCNCSYPDDMLQALLHDASEAYLMDVPRPLKNHLPEYKIIEDRLMNVIANKFGFRYPITENVKKTDELWLQLEWEYFMIGMPEATPITPMSAAWARIAFLDTFKMLNTHYGNKHS